MPPSQAKPARKWVTVQEAAASCGVSYYAVWSWIRNGCLMGGEPVKLEAARMGGRYRIKPAELAKFVKKLNA